MFTSGAAFAQHQAIGFTKNMPFSEGYIAGNTLYVAGQQGPDAHGKVTGTDIALQTTNAIAAVAKVVKEAGFQMTDIVSVTVYVTDLNNVPKMNEVYKKLMPDPETRASHCTGSRPDRRCQNRNLGNCRETLALVASPVACGPMPQVSPLRPWNLHKRMRYAIS